MTHDGTATTAPDRVGGRIASIDLVRGAIMVLMAIDHVRVYSGLPAGGSTPGIFFTRWVTHFSAPGFAFLAGTAAFLHGRKLNDASALARFLVTRGLLLVLLELTVIRFSWTFNVNYADFVLAGVIWMLGWCMVLLAGLVRFTPKTVGWTGVGIMLFQQIFHFLPRALPQSVRPAVGYVWEFFYPAGLERAPGLSILYVIVPWVGVMAAGYGFGTIMIREPAERRRLCLRIGLSAIALFLVAGGLLAALGPAPEEPTPFLFRLLNQGKYPPTQLFLLMTLGPIIALLPLVEGAHNWFADMLVTFGRVPLLYYLLHIPLIHVTALVVMLIREGVVTPEWYARAPFASVPDGHRWSLSLLYLVFVIDVAILYAACRWLARLKAERPGSVLRYF